MSAQPQVEGDVAPGTVLGDRYRVLRLIGEGGMGRVFLALDRVTEDEVAVKVLTDDRPIPKAAARFEREAKAIARIDHDNVVKISEVGESPRGGLYYVMEYLRGEELAETLDREGPMSWWRVRGFALQICDALQAAHERGVVHRDLKLENCFRLAGGDEPDFIKILDFGVAKLLGPEADDRLTNTGATVGTPGYMAPELCRGKSIDHRVDVYALGVMLFEMLTGNLPFAGEGFLDVALQHMHEPPPPLSRYLEPDAIPMGLEGVIERALAKDREDRFPTMAAFARALKRVGEPEEVVVSSDDEGIPLVARGGTEPAIDAMSSPSITGRTQVADTVESGSSVSRIVAFESGELELPPRVPTRVWGPVLGAVMLGALVAVTAWWSWHEPEPSVLAGGAAVEERAEPAPSREPEPIAVPGGSSGEVAGDEGDSNTGGPEVEAVAEPRPAPKPRKGLTRPQIDAGLRSVRPRLGGCVGELVGGAQGERVQVSLRVDRASGRVVSATAKASTTAVEQCVTEALGRALFPKAGAGVQTIKRSIRL